MFNKTKENIKWFFITLLKRLDSIFKNGGTNWSSTRIMSVLCVFVPVIVWAFVSVTTLTLVAMPESIVVIVIAGLTGKVASQFVTTKYENKNG